MLQTPGLSVNSVSVRAQAGPLIVAHRGEWAEMPENSIAAIEAARAAGAHMVEFDVQPCADGDLVVIHDETLDRTTNGAGPVAEMSFADIRTLNLRAGPGGDGAALTGLGVPTLPEALEAARGQILVNVDTKFVRDLDRVAETVLSLGMADQVVLKGPIDVDGNNDVFREAPWYGRIPFMPIMPARPGRFAEDAARVIDDLKPVMLEIDFSNLEDVIAARSVLVERGVRLWTNTLDIVHSLDYSDSRALSEPGTVWGTLIAAGITVLQTDRSAALARYLAGAR
ncbi:glycerophosphodiester phosphodiesterase family protein [Devosia nitrariae]|uniref:Glycerophosphoryl diester phosphodiesterase n=1 Tax=Devosia nitrariae TaxID=2071872 RepID=A0ABQ5VZ26_9HYPH|nr:glycerophosphodiester phosphodiesterase family protein [Devosia nitrariae]GLQ52890.1 glycerophosphoryl diester phosphodiesterase [Devosia nitrariae]